ncbi:MAG: protochlorophyllide oxidoreductase, partial [Synechococcales cyanobacterium]
MYTASALIHRGYHVIMACRDVGKGGDAAQRLGFSQDLFSLMQVDLGSLESTRCFAQEVVA